jgi:hypothetical protein
MRARIPPMLIAIVFVLAGTTEIAQLRHVLPELSAWRLVLLAYVAFSCAQAAFPSPGDHIGVRGTLTLITIIAIAIAVVVARDGQQELMILTRDLCLLLSVPSIASGGQPRCPVRDRISQADDLTGSQTATRHPRAVSTWCAWLW